MSFLGPEGKVAAARGIDLSVAEGETLALVGESGCGKTALCRAVLMLHARHAHIDSGRILLCGEDVTAMKEEELERVRGNCAAMIFQDPAASLNPVFSIGSQITEPILLHEKVSRKEAKERAVSLLHLVGIPDPEIRFYQYPHHFSGGMRQRVAIAIALACNPKLLIADEPTTALDPKMKGQIMELLKTVCRRENRAMIFVTHDLGLAAEIADRVAVMKDGVIVETASAREIFERPVHGYTKQLLHYAGYGKKGSHFHGKAGTDSEHKAKGEIAGGETKEISRQRRTADDVLVRVCGISKSFSLGQNRAQKVLDQFSLTIERGEIVGLIGPSGCGKSTLAKCLLGIHKPDTGSIEFAPGCRKQMIFQDSASAMNPRLTLKQIIAEPLILAGKKSRQKPGRQEIFEKVCAVSEQAGLSSSLLNMYPYDVSGGQRQRAAIARALITDPDFIIADEPVSSLDVTIQAQIVHLLKKLQTDRNLTMLLIAHDLPMTEHISDRIVEMGNNLHNWS